MRMLLCRLCCLCGVSIPTNPSNMCVNCIRSQVDITEGLQKQVTLLWCKDCERYLQPPKHWVRAGLESKELLVFCIKRLKGLQKVLTRTSSWSHSCCKGWILPCGCMHGAVHAAVRLGCVQDHQQLMGCCSTLSAAF